MQSKIMQSDNSRQYFQRSSRQNLPKRQAFILCDQTPSLFHYTAKPLRCQVFDLICLTSLTSQHLSIRKNNITILTNPALYGIIKT